MGLCPPKFTNLWSRARPGDDDVHRRIPYV